MLDAFYTLGQTGGGLRVCWRRLRGNDEDLDDGRLRDLAGTFSRRVRAYCTQQGIPLIEAEAGERKPELAEPHVPKDPQYRGLFLVITGNAPVPVWEVRRNAEGPIIEIRRRRQWPYVKHYYFHLLDPPWGHVTIRMCGHRPFGAQVILNGHEWVERAANRHTVSIAKRDNCFVEGSDFAGVDRLAGLLNRESAIGRLRAVCERWICSSCLCFALTRQEQQRSQFLYTFSVLQLELSRNLLFRRGATMTKVYQEHIDRTQPLGLEQLKTIFGTRHRPHRSSKRGRTGLKMVKSVLADSRCRYRTGTPINVAREFLSSLHSIDTSFNSDSDWWDAGGWRRMPKRYSRGE